MKNKIINNNIAPLFSNIKLNQKTILSENNKPILYNNFFKRSILFIKLYNKNLHNFILNKINKNKAILEPKSNENLKNKNIKKIENKNMLEYKNKNTNTIKSIYGNGKIKMLTPKNKMEIDNNKISQENKTNINKLIKTISIFNSEIAKSKNIVYQFNKNNKALSYSINNYVTTILESTFFSMFSLISKPVFVFTADKTIIQFFFYLNKIKYKSVSKSKFLSLNKSKLELLIFHLSKIYKKPIELELDRLYYPYYDSHILSNMLGFISNIVKYRFIIRKLFTIAKIKKPNKFIIQNKKRTSIIPSMLSGIKIRLAGRLLTQRVVPRLTIKTIQRGTLARGKANFIDTARFTNKNKRGAYSITITMGHIFY
jgi:hypothetical protein